MDNRTKRQKLQDMANQTESPNEAAIAKQKLEEMGPENSNRFSGNSFIGTSWDLNDIFAVYMRNVRVVTWTFNGNWNFYPPVSGFGEYRKADKDSFGSRSTTYNINPKKK